MGLTPEAKERFDHEVVSVSNPLGEVYHNGKHQPHQAVKRVGRAGGWTGSRTLGAREREALTWYTERYAIWQSGMTRCALSSADSMGGGAGAGGISRTEAQIVAGDFVAFARRFIPTTMIVLFDAIVHEELSFAEAGVRYWRMLSAERSKKVASAQFSMTAKLLADGLQRNGIIQ